MGKAVKNVVKAQNGKKKLSLRIIIISAVAVILAVSALIASVGIRNYVLRESVEFTYSGVLESQSVRTIEISEEEQAERAKEMKIRGQKSKFGFFCNNELFFEYPTAYGPLILANISSNDCIFIATILDEDGNLLYRSNGIESGKYLSQIRLFNPPTDGKYDCRLYVSAYDKETNELLGVQYTAITLLIGDYENAE